ncbi:bifunctional DNA primase/polymerase [Xanthobacter versatilis]|uniref:bifunctional DNA primase/polymerase n=1 Tax=Xanthobacter autotrophicus (strain ATCC BAA-1158 / Py2) TaxID=78245 RepID=UPI0037268B3D
MPVVFHPPFDPATIQTNAKLALALAPSLAIFPCDDTKQPVHGTPWKSARPGQIDRVQRWWAAHPDAMPAVHLGAVGLIVVDADGADGVAAFERITEPHGGVPECPMVDTPSSGRHFYFKQRPGEALGNSRGSLPPKSECPIDVRGDGGYVIAPDATRDDGVYLYPDGDPLDVLHAPELPDWLHAILTGKREEEPSPAPVAPSPPPKAPSSSLTAVRTLDMGHPRLRTWVEAAFDTEIRALEQCGTGGRNNQLNTSAFTVFQLVAAGWVAEDVAHSALVQAAEACGLVKDDGRRSVLRTIASARKGGMAQPRQVPEEFQ